MTNYMKKLKEEITSNESKYNCITDDTYLYVFFSNHFDDDNLNNIWFLYNLLKANNSEFPANEFLDFLYERFSEHKIKYINEKLKNYNMETQINDLIDYMYVFKVTERMLKINPESKKHMINEYPELLI